MRLRFREHRGIYRNRVVGQNWLKVGESAWLKVIQDKARGEGSYKAQEAWDNRSWEKKEAKKKAEEALKVAARATKVAAKAVEKGQIFNELAEDAAHDPWGRSSLNMPWDNYKPTAQGHIQQQQSPQQ